MTATFSRRRFLSCLGLGLSAGVVIPLSGCGTILHPERIGQTSGAIDWRIAALDGAGLLLFFVPGVIAFAVDFYNGTIFLPPAGTQLTAAESPSLKRVRVPQKNLNRTTIEEIVAVHTGRAMNLSGDSCYTEELSDIGQFWPIVRKLGEQTAQG